jgi:hypothetical protein
MSTPTTLPVVPLSGPCGGARSEVQTRCAEAERLTQAQVAHEQRLREVKRQLAEATAQRDADSRVRDRRSLDDAKSAARNAYHAAVAKSKEPADLHEAARIWLREIDQLNRQLALADQRSEDVVRHANELERALPGIELAADVARIAAEAAQEACLAARQGLARCEEVAQQRIEAGGRPPLAATASIAGVAGGQGADANSAPTGAPRGVRPISLVLRGDRQTLLSIALRLAEETGVEAGRLQLLLLELREAIAARALEEQAFRFPDNHPFWRQFPAAGGRQIATSLASMGYSFDGRGGWTDGRIPTIRELAVALSHVGLDPRGLRRPSGQEAIDHLWQGTTVQVEEYLATRAPNLDLQDVTACLGARAARLNELWDMWGRLRPLLLTPSA